MQVIQSPAMCKTPMRPAPGTAIISGDPGYRHSASGLDALQRSSSCVAVRRPSDDLTADVRHGKRGRLPSDMFGAEPLGARADSPTKLASRHLHDGKPLASPTHGSYQRQTLTGDPQPCKWGDPQFPTTGRSITVKLIRMNAATSVPLLIREFGGYTVTSDWQLSHLLQMSEMYTGVHRKAQKLYHAGKEITEGCTIRQALGLEECRLPSKLAVHMVVDEDMFPQCLGPFGVVEVPLSDEDFILPRSTPCGFHWTMKNEVVERHGVRSTDSTQVTAHCSPTHLITFNSQERIYANIPPEAVECAWSYPVANWDKVEQDPHLLEDWAQCQKEHSAVKDFLVVGGFIYLDSDQRIVQVTTPCNYLDKMGGLNFSKPQKWDPAWTEPLVEDGRFHHVTISPLREAGVRLFCWLRPNERFDDEDGNALPRQPDVPHGGFAYLFHDMTEASPQDLAVDCYFAIAFMCEHSPDLAESFPLVHEECPADLIGHTSAQLNQHCIDSH